VKPLQSSLKPLVEGYQSGMRTGDKIFAMFCLLGGTISLPYMMGKPLNMIEEQCQASVSQMVELNAKEQAAALKMFWQLCLNLMGLSNNTVELSGKAMDEKELVFTGAVNMYFVLVKNIAFNLFGQYESVASLVIKKEAQQHLVVKGGSYTALMYTFHRSLSLYAMAQKNRNKKKKYMTKANRLHKELAASLKKGNPNALHYVSFLNAERNALKQKKNREETVEQEYKNAITVSLRGGYVHDAALARERYAQFLLNEVGDIEEAKYQIEAAIDCYKGWGAMGKVQHLRNQQERILAESQTK